MPVKKFRLFLILGLIIIAACSPLLDQSTEPDSTSTPGATLVGTQSPPSDAFLTPHPWDDLDAYMQMLSAATFDPDQILPGASLYHIALTVPDDLSAPLTGRLAIKYTNQENASLSEIIFRLFPNYYGGTLTVKNILADGQKVGSQSESQDTALRVELPAPLPPEKSIIISLDFTLMLPETMGGNYGLLGYFEDILVLDTFYPMIPVYDQQGWYTHYPYTNGDLTYQDASYYLVEVTAPADFVMAASGSLVSTSTDDQLQRVTYAAGPARDFSLAGSREFTVVSATVEGIQVNSYALHGNLANQEKALTYAMQALQTFSDLFGPYPYTEFDVVSSPMRALGVEYPGITGIFLGLFEEGEELYGIPSEALLESVIVHEVGHQWFYNQVGNDQQNEPWVDESITQYVTYLFFDTRQKNGQAAGLVADWQSRLSSVEDDQMAIGLPAGAYDGVEYSGIIYGRGPLFYWDLASQIGQDSLISAMRQYVQDYRWQLANTQAIQTELENACGCDLTENFDSWINPREGN